MLVIVRKKNNVWHIERTQKFCQCIQRTPMRVCSKKSTRSISQSGLGNRKLWRTKNKCRSMATFEISEKLITDPTEPRRREKFWHLREIKNANVAPIVRWIWNHNLHLFVQPRGATSSGIIRVHLITGFYVRALKTKE